MTAKEYLTQIETLNRRICRRNAELAELIELKNSIGGVDYSAGRASSVKKFEAGFENLSIKIIDEGSRIEKDINNLINIKSKIINQIENMNNDIYKDILFYRYVDLRSLGWIADKQGYSYVHTCRLHGWALQAFERQYMQDDNQC